MSRFGRRVRIGRRIRKDWWRRSPLSVLRLAVAFWRMSRQQADMGVLIDWSGNGHHGYFGGVRRAFIGDDYDGSRGLHLPGIAGNSASIPDSGPLTLTDFTADALVAPIDATPAAEISLIGQWPSAGQYSWLFRQRTDKKLVVYLSTDGTAASSVISTAALPTSDEEVVEARVVFDGDNGAGGHDVSFYYRLGGTGAWVQLGTTVTTGGTIALHDSTGVLEFGSNDAGTAGLWAGNIYRAIIYSDLTETTKVLDVDFTTQSQGDRSFTSYGGNVVTINQAGSSTAEPELLFYEGVVYVWLPGTSGNVLSTPNAAALQLTGDITLVFELIADDYTPGSIQYFINKNNFGTDRSYYWFLNSAGTVSLVWTTDGAIGTAQTATSTAALPFADGTYGEVKVELDVDNDAGGYNVKFYTRTSSLVAWVQLGTTVVGGAPTSIYVSTQTVYLGGAGLTSQLLTGSIYGARVYSGLESGGSATLALDYNPNVSTTVDQANGAVITINRSASGYKTTVVDETKAVFDGVDDYIEVDDHDDLDFGAGDSFTAGFVGLSHDVTPTSTGTPLAKKPADGVSAGWLLNNSTGGEGQLHFGDDAIAEYANGQPLIDGARFVLVGRRIAQAEARTFVDGVGASGNADATSASLANADAMRIGRKSGSGTNYYTGEFMASPIFRRALTDAQIAQLTQDLAK